VQITLRPRLMIFSAIRRTSFAFASVVSIVHAPKESDQPLQKAFLWFAVRPNSLPSTLCRILFYTSVVKQLLLRASRSTLIQPKPIMSIFLYFIQGLAPKFLVVTSPVRSSEQDHMVLCLHFSGII